MADARWLPLDNRTVTSELNKIRDAIGQLAKSYAAESFFGLDKEDPHEQARFCNYLAPYFGFAHTGHETAMELLHMKHAPRLTLTAFLSAHVHHNIFASPFFFVNRNLLEGPNETGSHANSEEQRKPSKILGSIYRTACSCEFAFGRFS